MPRGFLNVHRVFGFITASALALTPLAVLGQEASPAPSEAAGCVAAPRDIEELVGFYFDPEGTPLARPEMAAAAPEEALPSGEDADAATVEAVQAVLEQVFLCFEVEQYARALALMTEDLARQIGPDSSNPNEDSPEEVRALFTDQLAIEPPAGATLQMALGEGRDVRLLEDGRVGGIWTVQGDAAFLVFEQVDGQWLLDEIIDIIEVVDTGSNMGTPAP